MSNPSPVSGSELRVLPKKGFQIIREWLIPFVMGEYLLCCPEVGLPDGMFTVYRHEERSVVVA
jgi:hypothetical protein